jgi:hypothetical protein
MIGRTVANIFVNDDDDDDDDDNWIKFFIYLLP